MLFDPQDEKPDIRRAGREVIQRIIDNVKGHLQLHPLRILLLAFIAGGLLCYGAAMGVRLSVGLGSPGAEHFMVTFGFLAGFTVTSLSGNTGSLAVPLGRRFVFVLHNVNCEYNRAALKRVALFWFIINVGNVIGCLSTAAMLIYVQIFNQADKERLNDILDEKLKNADDGLSGICVVFVSAMLANWIVGHCVLNATSSRHVIGRVAGIFYCVFMFSVPGLQHGAATNGQIFLGLMSELDAVSWGRAIWGNILPTILGNALGGLIFVAWPFWYSHYFKRFPENNWRSRIEKSLPTSSIDDERLTALA